MLRTRSRTTVPLQRVRFDDIKPSKVLQSDVVCITNPVTKSDEEHVVNTFKEEVLIDPHLRSSDFDLEVQIRAGVQLKDCGKYFSPSSPEEYANVVGNLANYLSTLQSQDNLPDQVTPVELRQTETSE